MPIPATTGRFRSSVKEMEIGDYIAMSRNDTAGLYLTNQVSQLEEIPVGGQSSALALTGKFFYLVKVAKGLLVADRVQQVGFTWQALNIAKYGSGRSLVINNIPFLQRSLSGGVGYLGENGSLSLTNQNRGAWPKNNEWDKYIVNFPKELIKAGSTTDDVFHWSPCWTWCHETPVTNVINHYGDYPGTSTRRVVRGFMDLNAFSHVLVTQVASHVGFRLVLEYDETKL